jgi:hypothetical protein
MKRPYSRPVATAIARDDTERLAGDETLRGLDFQA